MYIHSGNNLVINTKDIIGIFDLDNTTVSVRGREFLPMAQERGTDYQCDGRAAGFICGYVV